MTVNSAGCGFSATDSHVYLDHRGHCPGFYRLGLPHGPLGVPNPFGNATGWGHWRIPGLHPSQLYEVFVVNPSCGLSDGDFKAEYPLAITFQSGPDFATQQPFHIGGRPCESQSWPEYNQYQPSVAAGLCPADSYGDLWVDLYAGLGPARPGSADLPLPSQVVAVPASLVTPPGTSCQEVVLSTPSGPMVQTGDCNIGGSSSQTTENSACGYYRAGDAGVSHNAQMTIGGLNPTHVYEVLAVNRINDGQCAYGYSNVKPMQVLLDSAVTGMPPPKAVTESATSVSLRTTLDGDPSVDAAVLTTVEDASCGVRVTSPGQPTPFPVSGPVFAPVFGGAPVVVPAGPEPIGVPDAPVIPAFDFGGCAASVPLRVDLGVSMPTSAGTIGVSEVAVGPTPFPAYVEAVDLGAATLAAVAGRVVIDVARLESSYLPARGCTPTPYTGLLTGPGTEWNCRGKGDNCVIRIPKLADGASYIEAYPPDSPNSLLPQLQRCFSDGLDGLKDYFKIHLRQPWMSSLPPITPIPNGSSPGSSTGPGRSRGPRIGGRRQPFVGTGSGSPPSGTSSHGPARPPAVQRFYRNGHVYF